MTFYIYRDARGEWRWYLQTGNHRKIADSGEGYQHKKDCLDAIELVRGSDVAPVRER